jgi:2-C-methyl-D-erythritol 4-phosphate cytidylyltransferase
VLIHDGGRPWVSAALINAVINTTAVFGATVPVLPLTETPKELDLRTKPAFICRHLRRSIVVSAQTPQGFLFPDILLAHRKAAENGGFEYTDDSEIWSETFGIAVTVPGEAANRKITFPEDLDGKEWS